jgi:hypothetical protein
MTTQKSDGSFVKLPNPLLDRILKFGKSLLRVALHSH